MPNSKPVHWIAAALLLTFSLVSGACAHSNTATQNPPAPPQVQVLQYALTAATSNQALGAAVHLACRPAPPAVATITDQHLCSELADGVRAAAAGIEQIRAEAASGDAWSVMKPKIAAIVSAIALNYAVPGGNDQLVSQISALTATLANIKGVQ